MDWDAIPEMNILQLYRRACDVLIEGKVSVLEILVFLLPTRSPMVTFPRTAIVTGTGCSPWGISTCQVSCGVRTSLSGPVPVQVMVKLSPAVGVPNLDMVTKNRLASSAVHKTTFNSSIIHVSVYFLEQKMLRKAHQ